MGDSDLTFLHRDPIPHKHRNKSTCHWGLHNWFRCNGCIISHSRKLHYPSQVWGDWLHTVVMVNPLVFGTESSSIKDIKDTNLS